MNPVLCTEQRSLSSALLGIPVNPLPTQGAIHNMKLLDSNGAQLALTTMSTANEGWNGTGDWTNGKQFRNIRALFSMYDNPLQALVLQKSGITTFAQLDHKRIGVGPRSRTGKPPCNRQKFITGWALSYTG
jgi:TRAP-type uncharacterized transport system substrate-binding protein